MGKIRKKFSEGISGRRQADKKIIPCQCLDVVEAAHRRRVYPLMYCHMELSGHVDADRLKRSVALSCKAVPEILCVYDYKKRGFVDWGYTADDLVRCAKKLPRLFFFPDLSQRPQMQILMIPGEKGDLVTVVMSHILTDGMGFLQYLYLLASLYNGGEPEELVSNVRRLSPLLENIRVSAATEQTRRNRFAWVAPLRAAEKGGHRFCLTSQISKEHMAVVHERAKQWGVTLNDVFLTAYARVIGRLQRTNIVVLPCPADLRKFRPEQNSLTVANMTGIYRKITVEIPDGCSFTETLQQVHMEMALQKSGYRCFSGVQALYQAFGRVPDTLLELVIRAAYRLPPVSYTNFGAIDHEKLFFNDCVIQNCFLTGTYRLPPDFQLTVSTFKNRCTLNCTLIGGADAGKKGQYILEQVKNEILRWIKE